MDTSNPSSFLFPIAKLPTAPGIEVTNCIERLHYIYCKNIYLPPDTLRHIGPNTTHLTIPRTKLLNKQDEDIVIDSGYASAEEDYLEDEGRKERNGFNEALQELRNDPYERDFTVRWITSFIARSEIWVYSDPILPDDALEEREAIVDAAAEVLTACANANTTEDEALSRDFHFTLHPSGKKLSVILNDLFDSQDHSSVGLQSWASSVHFAKMLCEDPGAYGLDTSDSRVLELGAGTGLLSLTAANILDSTCEIVASDYHPDVLANLQRNVELNFPSSEPKPITISLLDWQFPLDVPPFDKSFDIILAADVVYESEHAKWIKKCVEQLLKRPSQAYPSGGSFWMIIAIRDTGRHEGLASSVLQVFPLIDDTAGPSANLSLRSTFVRDINRSEGVGRADESGYRLFRICWA